MLPPGMSLTAFEAETHQPFVFPGAGRGPDPARHHGAALLVHGFPGTPGELRPMGQLLAAAGWTAHGVLLPGFGVGLSTLPDRKHTEWVEHVCSALVALRRDYDPVIVVGHSMGGALALHAATRVPGVDGLVLLAPFWKVDNPLWALLPAFKLVIRTVQPFRLVRIDFSNPDTQEGIHQFMPDADLNDPQVRAAIRDFTLPLSLFDELRRAGQLARDGAPKLTIPTLIIQGTQDDVTKPHLTRRLVDHIGGPVRYLEVPAEHDLTTEGSLAWGRIGDAVLDFTDIFTATPA
jgi:carboxylesterase